MPALLDFVPNSWGPKFDTESGSVALTRTGPNEIAFKAPAHMALVMFTPQPNREVALNSDRKRVFLAPVGSIEIVPAESDLFARWIADKENLLIALDQQRLAQLAGVEFQNEDFEFRPSKAGYVDEKALLLANLIHDESQRQEATNDICLDALITIFATYLLRTYSSHQDRPARLLTGGLPPRRWRIVTDYVRANLTGDLSITRLANLAGLSPSHFLRAFRHSFGLAPHQYVVAQRLSLAKELAGATDMPLSEVAKAAGFSSNSHMTATMTRLWSVTPVELRRGERQKRSVAE